MRPLHTLTLRVQGDWRDAWLYKETLVLWSPGGELATVPFDSLRAEVRRTHGHATAVACDYLIFRNDWKLSAQFQDLLRIEGIRKNFLALFEGNARLSVATSVPASVVHAVDAHAGYAIDTVVYGNRILTATDEGLFEAQYDPAFPNSNSPTVQVSTLPARSVAARNGRFAAAQGEEGLGHREIRFGDGGDWWRSVENEPFETVDDVSYRASFSSYNLLNYRGDRSPSFLRAKLERVQAEGSSRYDETKISGFRDPTDLDQLLFDAADTDVEEYVVGNADYRLLVRNRQGLEVVNLSTFSEDADVQINSSPGFSRRNLNEDIARRALSTQAVSSGFLVETFDSVALISARGSYQLLDEPRARIRSFPYSRRHKDCFIAIGDGFVELVGYLPGLVAEDADTSAAPF